MKIINQLFDYILGAVCKGAGLTNKSSFHLIILVVNVLLSIPNLFFFFILDANEHIVFWLGSTPTTVNLFVPAVLLCLSLQLPLLNCLNVRTQFVRNYILMFFMIAGCVLMGAGIYVLQEAHEVSNDLIYACGTSRLTAKIQSEWQALHDFRKECAEEEEVDDIFIQQCPGFAEYREGRRIYVDYIEEMEIDYNCQGFCQFFSEPLFNVEGSTGKRCASAIGEDVQRVGHWVGGPTTATGMTTIMFGVLLANYDHL